MGTYALSFGLILFGDMDSWFLLGVYIVLEILYFRYPVLSFFSLYDRWGLVP